MHFDDLPVLPTTPGVYIFRGKTNVPIYIGKANNLRSRVGQHFKAGGKSGRFTSEAVSLEFITARNEVEALVLEANLIKQHRPHYNVLLKDDKHYPFLKLTAEKFPMLLINEARAEGRRQLLRPLPRRGRSSAGQEPDRHHVSAAEEFRPADAAQTSAPA